MTQAEAMKAMDDALADGLKNLLRVYTMDGSADALRRFEKEAAQWKRSHELASETIKHVFGGPDA